MTGHKPRRANVRSFEAAQGCAVSSNQAELAARNRRRRRQVLEKPREKVTLKSNVRQTMCFMLLLSVTVRRGSHRWYRRNPGRAFVAVVGINEHLFIDEWDSYCRRRTASRAGRTCPSARRHQHLGLNPGGEMLVVDIAQPGENLIFALVERVEVAEDRSSAPHRRPPQGPSPRPLIVAEERKDGRGPLDARLQSGAGEGQPAALRAAGCADAVRVDLRHPHHHPGELRRIEIDLAE